MLTHWRWARLALYDYGYGMLCVAQATHYMPGMLLTRQFSLFICYVLHLLCGGKLHAMSATQTKTQLKPLGDRVVLEMIEDTNQTSGGIFIPDTAKERPQKAKVIAIGPGRRNEKGELEPMNVSIGDVVLFAKYGGTDIKIDGVELKILSEKDILAIIA